jgi:hypothetical protein
LAIYTFALENFTIRTTRSRHDDTDEVTFGLQIGGRQFPVQSYSAGDVNNGQYSVQLKFATVFVSVDSTAVSISYQIYNGDTTKLPTSLAQLNIDLGQQAVQFVQQHIEQGNPNDYTDFPEDPDNPRPPDDGQDYADTSWVEVLEEVEIGSVLKALASFVAPNCDGFTAIGTIGKPKSDWDKAIDNAGGQIYRQTISYPGTTSNAGCGDNSDYAVTWSVSRIRATGPRPYSVRKFLQDNHITLNPGIRSLDPVNPISVLGLLF